MNTKEKILVTALRLFAVYGYEAVSVSRIAGELAVVGHIPEEAASFGRIPGLFQ